MSAAQWVEIVADVLGAAATVARLIGGTEGAAVARRVEEILSDAEFPTLRRAARRVGEEAKDRLGGP